MASIPITGFVITSSSAQDRSSPSTLVSASHSAATRRKLTTALLITLFQVQPDFSILRPPPAAAFDLGILAPDQTLEEAELMAKVHARDLFGMKSLIEKESWREVQIVLRESGSGLKQDMYTIIQCLPGEKRAEMRRFYSLLFNNVTRMDYAARRKDADAVLEHYNNIVELLNHIFRILS